MQQEAAHELVDGQRHGLDPCARRAPERDSPSSGRRRDDRRMRRCGCLRWRRGGCSATDERGRFRGRRTGAWRRRPIRRGAATRTASEHVGVGEPGEVAEGQPAAPHEGRDQTFRKRRRKKRDRTRTGRKKPACRRSAFAVRRQAAAGDDDVDVRMVGSADPMCAARW